MTYKFLTFKDWRYEFYRDEQGYTHYPEDDKDCEYTEEDRDIELQTWAYFMLRGLYSTQRKTWSQELKDIHDGFYIEYGYGPIRGKSSIGWQIYQTSWRAENEQGEIKESLRVGLFRFPYPKEADDFLQYGYNGVTSKELLTILYQIPSDWKVSPRFTYGINDLSSIITLTRSIQVL